jgi:hypothetical protein
MIRTNLLHSAHDKPGFPLRESAGVEEVDGKGALILRIAPINLRPNEEAEGA